MSTKALTGQQIAEAGLDGWALLTHYGIFRLHTRIHTMTFAAGRQVVNAIGEAAEQLNHHADLDLRPSRVDVRLDSGREAGGVTELDVNLARRISDIAAAAGAELDGRSVGSGQLRTRSRIPVLFRTEKPKRLSIARKQRVLFHTDAKCD